jgi:hypothetical protein
MFADQLRVARPPEGARGGVSHQNFSVSIQYEESLFRTTGVRTGGSSRLGLRRSFHEARCGRDDGKATSVPAAQTVTDPGALLREKQLILLHRDHPAETFRIF